MRSYWHDILPCTHGFRFRSLALSKLVLYRERRSEASDPWSCTSVNGPKWSPALHRCEWTQMICKVCSPYLSLSLSLSLFLFFTSQSQICRARLCNPSRIHGGNEPTKKTQTDAFFLHSILFLLSLRWAETEWDTRGLLHRYILPLSSKRCA